MQFADHSSGEPTDQQIDRRRDPNYRGPPRSSGSPVHGPSREHRSYRGGRRGGRGGGGGGGGGQHSHTRGPPRRPEVKVSGLPFAVNKNDLLDLFALFGALDAEIQKNNQGSSRGFGHVLFPNVQGVKNQDQSRVRKCRGRRPRSNAGTRV